MDLFTTKPPKSRLLDLPPEIREHIFTFAVTSEKPIVTFRLDTFQQDSYEEASQPTITRVSRQVRRETLPLFYECNEFIIHTEGQKAEDAYCWLHYNQPHLPKLARFALWVRYVARVDNVSPSSGAIGVYLQHDAREGCWKVSDEWRWITVVRKPAMVKQDGSILVEISRHFMEGRSRSELDAEQYVEFMKKLKALYVKEKMV